MFCIGSRTFYALWNDIVFNFEYLRDRDYFVSHMDMAEAITAKAAYAIGIYNSVRVPASCKLGANKDRNDRIKRWYYGNK